ncbi:hypothetical protein NDU88_006404 [Pleurodeles waltl]|uniref:Uncharacterized protein n=1 Tax=Pleurodeles waltl TaxID=8319 RepID=A0AAV7VQW6_PLEWA|nr:hypothetical protein NDU88_006404 [Pleurodeles waltl]
MHTGNKSLKSSPPPRLKRLAPSSKSKSQRQQSVLHSAAGPRREPPGTSVRFVRFVSRSEERGGGAHGERGGGAHRERGGGAHTEAGTDGDDQWCGLPRGHHLLLPFIVRPVIPDRSGRSG